MQQIKQKTKMKPQQEKIIPKIPKYNLFISVIDILVKEKNISQMIEKEAEVQVLKLLILEPLQLKVT